MKRSDYHVYACLPFVELAQESTIQMGPLLFWPASKYEKFIEPSYHSIFREYEESITQIKAHAEGRKEPINTVKIPMQSTTYISINDSIPYELRECLIIDALYLLYFACIFRNLYYGNEIPSFGAFRKLIPASQEFFQYKPNWEHLHIQETNREETVCIHLSDQEICEAFGKMLEVSYSDHNKLKEKTDYKRFIRSIRYLVDRFFQRFVNLFKKGLEIPEIIFEPEDVIFIVSGFEALFDINDQEAAADFKHKLRPLLHLKYSKPVEFFWKWVDDFYEVKRKIVHGGLTPDPYFKKNPNFEVSHILIGIKVFIYSIYYMLFKYHLLDSKKESPNLPPDFKWIHPEELLIFFWTEGTILHRLNLLVSRLNKGSDDEKEMEEIYADIQFLVNLFVLMEEKYLQGNQLGDVKFIPTPPHELEKEVKHLLEQMDIMKEGHLFPPHFRKAIKEIASRGV